MEEFVDWTGQAGQDAADEMSGAPPVQHYNANPSSYQQDRSNGPYLNPNFPGSISCDIKPRLTKEQHDILENHYQKQNKPNTNTKKSFAESLNVSLDKVNVSVRCGDAIRANANICRRIGSRIGVQNLNRMQRNMLGSLISSKATGSRRPTARVLQASSTHRRLITTSCSNGRWNKVPLKGSALLPSRTNNGFRYTECRTVNLKRSLCRAISLLSNSKVKRS